MAQIYGEQQVNVRTERPAPAHSTAAEMFRANEHVVTHRLWLLIHLAATWVAKVKAVGTENGYQCAHYPRRGRPGGGIERSTITRGWTCSRLRANGLRVSASFQRNMSGPVRRPSPPAPASPVRGRPVLDAQSPPQSLDSFLWGAAVSVRPIPPCCAAHAGVALAQFPTAAAAGHAGMAAVPFKWPRRVARTAS